MSEREKLKTVPKNEPINVLDSNIAASDTETTVASSAKNIKVSKKRI